MGQKQGDPLCRNNEKYVAWTISSFPASTSCGDLYYQKQVYVDNTLLVKVFSMKLTKYYSLNFKIINSDGSISQKVRCYKSGTNEKSDGIRDETMEALAASSIMWGTYPVYENDNNAKLMGIERWNKDKAIKFDPVSATYPLGNLNQRTYYSQWTITLYRFYAKDTMIWGLVFYKGLTDQLQDGQEIKLKITIKNSRDVDAANLPYKQSDHTDEWDFIQSELEVTIDLTTLGESGTYFFEKADKSLNIFFVNEVGEL